MPRKQSALAVSAVNAPVATAVRRARRGEATVLTSRGRPVARIVPLDDDEGLDWGTGEPLRGMEDHELAGEPEVDVEAIVRAGRR